MAYQRILNPGPRSNRFAFSGAPSLGACCRACEHDLPCGTPMGTTKGGGGAAPGNVVGVDPSVEVLGNAVKALAQHSHAAFGEVRLNRTLYDRLKRQAAQPAQDSFRLTPAEAKQFVTGTVVDVTAAYVKARELGTLTAANPTRRDQLMATQRQLARTGQAMLDQATRALDSARHEGQGGGTSGLGFVCGGACIATIAVIAAGIAILITGALVYSWAQSASELQSAMTMADRICRETPGGCTPQQRAHLIRELRMPDPISRGVENVTQGIGQGLRTTVIVLGVGGAVSLGVYAWLRLTPAGRRVYKKLTGRGA